MKCEICGRECDGLKGLSSHIVQFHKIKIKDYYDKYLKKENEEFCYCGKKNNFYGLKGYQKYCSHKCSSNSLITREKCKKTLIKNFGVEHPYQSEKIKNQFVKTMNKNHGCNYTLQSKFLKNKVNNTNLDKYGYVDVMKNNLISYKSKLKNLDNYQNPLLMLQINKKRQNTCKLKYNTDHPSKSKKIKEKTKQTWLKNWGVGHPLKTKEIQEKIKQTNLKKYGVENPWQSKEIQEKIKQTNLKKYGVDNWSKTKYGKLMFREKTIKMIEQQKFNGEPLIPFIGKIERKCFDELQSIFNIDIERNPKIDGYYPDGRIQQLRLLFEFDEPFHYINGYSLKDIERENYLTSQGYIMYRIKDYDWVHNKEKIINEFKILIENSDQIRN